MGLTSTNMVTAWEWDGNAPMIVGSAVMARTEELEATIAPKSRQAADRRRRTDDAEMEWEVQVQVRDGWRAWVYSPCRRGRELGVLLLRVSPYFSRLIGSRCDVALVSVVVDVSISIELFDTKVGGMRVCVPFRAHKDMQVM